MVWAALTGCATGPLASWSRTDQALFAVNLGCHGVDYWQTEWALENGYEEGNPLLGSHPSDEKLLAGKAVAGALAWWAGRDDEKRTASLIALTVPCLAIVAHNYSEGARP